MVEKIKEGCRPEKIVLFGSYAHGGFHQDSDIDLLIIKESIQRRDERDREIRELLKEVKVPLDIFVYTPDEAKKFCALKGSFINEIFNTGEVLYERYRLFSLPPGCGKVSKRLFNFKGYPICEKPRFGLFIEIMYRDM
ncbi:MAG: nucleotidyltransferase domain-containing protein [Candidatus Omnitrophica bacterium]|nr:nucleotidyltransferase domain-containing protein [Candidatus Omnitrophota bacterium]